MKWDLASQTEENMRKLLSMAVVAVAVLVLTAGPAVAGQVYVLSDTQLSKIWAANTHNVDVEDFAIAGDDNAANDGSNVSDNPSESAVAQDDSTALNADIDDVALGGDNAASGGSTVDDSTTQTTVNDNDTDVAVDVDVEDVAVALGDGNAASGGSTAADDLVQQSVSNSQNFANGVAISNALLSQIAQQSNVATVDTSSHRIRIDQQNFAHF